MRGEARALRSSLRRFAVLDVSAAAQVAQPFREGRLELLLAQDIACLLAQLARVERRLAAVDDLDQVNAEARRHRIGNAADRQRSHRLLELGNERSGRGPAEIAALRRA